MPHGMWANCDKMQKIKCRDIDLNVQTYLFHFLWSWQSDAKVKLDNMRDAQINGLLSLFLKKQIIEYQKCLIKTFIISKIIELEARLLKDA